MSSVGLLAVVGGLSIWHWLIVLALVLVLFGGKGKISSLMGDLAKGIQSFKKGMKEGEEDGRGAAAIPDAHKTVDVAPERKAETPRTES